MNKAEWLVKRRQGITGTDVSKIMGLSHWGSMKDVYFDKLGVSAPVVQNEKMLWGTKLEALIRDHFAESNAVKVVEPGFIQGKEDWIIGNPDGIVVDKHDKWEYGLEIKTAKICTPSVKRLWEGKVPLDYEYQCRWYMLLTDLPYWRVAVLMNGSEYHDDHFIYRDEKLEQQMYDKCSEFWHKFVVPKILPC